MFFFQKFGIFTQEIYFNEKNHLKFILDQSKYRNLNLATKRVIQLIKRSSEVQERYKKCFNILSNIKRKY